MFKCTQVSTEPKELSLTLAKATAIKEKEDKRKDRPTQADVSKASSILVDFGMSASKIDNFKKEALNCASRSDLDRLRKEWIKKQLFK